MPKVKDIHELMRTLQLVVREKPRRKVYLRGAPRTILQPTEAQKEVRRRVAEAARKAAGLKGLAPDGLPWAAHFVKQELTGFKSRRRVEKPREWEFRLTESPPAVTPIGLIGAQPTPKPTPERLRKLFEIILRER